MQQQTVHVVEGSKDWGTFKVSQMNWSSQGHIWCILVNWYGNDRDQAVFYDHDNTGIFKNQHGNLQAKFNTEVDHEIELNKIIKDLEGSISPEITKKIFDLSKVDKRFSYLDDNNNLIEPKPSTFEQFLTSTGIRDHIPKDVEGLTRVKIIKSSGEEYWYKNFIGREYNVDLKKSNSEKLMVVFDKSIVLDYNLTISTEDVVNV